MVSETVAAGIIGGLLTIFSGLLVCSLWIWRHTTSLEAEAQDRITELENNQRSNFSAELAELYTQIDEAIQEDEEIPDEMTNEEYVVNTIYRVVDKDDVDTVVTELEKIGDSRETYKKHVERYNEAWEKCAYTALGILAIGLFFTIAVITDGGAFGNGPTFIYFILGTLIVVQGKDTFDTFKEANKLKSEFEEMWEDYKKPE